MPDAHLTRRRFLKRSLAAAAVVGCSACGAGANGQGVPLDTIIVGGGLAGLRLLERLVQAGSPALLLEAAPHLGGRIRTLRKGLPPGTWAELGAERVARTHHRLQALIGDLGLELVDYPAGTGRLMMRHAGAWFPVDTNGDLPPELRAGLSARELAAWPAGVEELYFSAQEEPPDSGSGPALAWLRARGLTAAGERLARTFSPLPLESVCARDWWQATRDILHMGRPQTVAGGVDRIVSALALRHSGLIRTAAEVTMVRIKESEAELSLADGSSLHAPRVALALPLAPLRRLEFAGGMPALVKQALGGRALAEEIKVHVDYDVRALGEASIRPYCMGLDFPRMTWPSPGASPDGRGVLNAMAVREDVAVVRAARARGGGALLQLVRRRLPVELEPGRVVHSHDFNTDPLIGGTFSYVEAGAQAPSRTRREGPLVLAGSDLSDHSGWMEGALQSADNAFEEIMKS